jgi:hypothetical protein
MMAFTDDGQVYVRVCKHSGPGVLVARGQCPRLAAHQCLGSHARHMCELLPLEQVGTTPCIHGWQVCDEMVWERDARYGVDSQARAQNRQAREAWYYTVKLCARTDSSTAVRALGTMFSAALCSHNAQCCIKHCA